MASQLPSPSERAWRVCTQGIHYTGHRRYVQGAVGMYRVSRLLSYHRLQRGHGGYVHRVYTIQGTAGMYRVQWVCTGCSGYVQGTGCMYRVQWVCIEYSEYVQGTGCMYRVQWVCTGYHGFSATIAFREGTAGMYTGYTLYRAPPVCTGCSGYVQGTGCMYRVQWVFTGYMGMYRVSQLLGHHRLQRGHSGYVDLLSTDYTGTVSMYRVQGVCTGYSGYVLSTDYTGTVSMYRVQWVCTGYSGYVLSTDYIGTVSMYRVQWVCTGYSGYVLGTDYTGTVSMYRVQWGMYRVHGYHGFSATIAFREGTAGMYTGYTLYRAPPVCTGCSGYVQGITASQLPSPSERAQRVCTQGIYYTGYHGYVQGAVGMYRVQWVCTGYRLYRHSEYVQGTVGMYRVQWVCTGYHGFSATIAFREGMAGMYTGYTLYSAPRVCTGCSGYVQGTVGMYRVQGVCTGYSGYFTGYHSFLATIAFREGTMGMY